MPWTTRPAWVPGVERGDVGRERERAACSGIGNDWLLIAMYFRWSKTLKSAPHVKGASSRKNVPSAKLRVSPCAASAVSARGSHVAEPVDVRPLRAVVRERVAARRLERVVDLRRDVRRTRRRPLVAATSIAAAATTAPMSTLAWVLRYLGEGDPTCPPPV